MSVREYVGARYVPLFADPLEWTPTKTYEPLTIVQYQGSSYTSRQYVPQGTDIMNEDFWALTGNYNAQVEAYRQEVRSFDGRITENTDNISSLRLDVDKNAGDIAANQADIQKNATDIVGANEAIQKNATDIVGANEAIQKNATDIVNLNNKFPVQLEDLSKPVMVAIGDSFGIDAATAPNWWHTYLANGLCCIDKHYCMGQSGFINRNVSNGKNFNSLLDDANADTSFNNSNVKYVVCFGGLNDQNQPFNTNNISTAISGFISNAKNYFPNAQIIIAGPTTWYNKIKPDAWVDYITWQDAFSYCCKAAIKTSPVTASFIDTQNAFAGISNYFVGQSNGNHFTDAGSRAAAAWILNGINGNSNLKQFTYGSADVFSITDGVVAGKVSYNYSILDTYNLLTYNYNFSSGSPVVSGQDYGFTVPGEFKCTETRNYSGTAQGKGQWIYPTSGVWSPSVHGVRGNNEYQKKSLVIVTFLPENFDGQLYGSISWMNY